MVRPRLSRPDVVEKAGAEAGEGKHQQMRERSLASVASPSVVVSGCACGTRRARYTTSSQDARGGPRAKKRGKDGMKAGPRLGVRLVGELCYCSPRRCAALGRPWLSFGRRLCFVRGQRVAGQGQREISRRGETTQPSNCWSCSIAGAPIMIMRITWGKLRAGSWQEYEQAYRATVAGKEVPGLRGRWLAQDVNDPDGGFAVSVWESLDAMHAYEQSAVFKQEIQPKLQPFFVGEYTTYRCDVKYEQ